MVAALAQVFADKQLMQLSIWKKEWDDEKGEFEPIDLSYKPYGYHQTRIWKKQYRIRQPDLWTSWP